MDPYDPCLRLQALTPYTLTHTQIIDRPSPRKIEMEFNEKTGQTAVMRDRAEPGKCIDQVPVHTGLFHLSHYAPIFLLVLSQTTWSLPFPVLGYSPKHSITRLPQSQNVLPIMHPIICTVPLGSHCWQLTRVLFVFPQCAMVSLHSFEGVQASFYHHITWHKPFNYPIQGTKKCIIFLMTRHLPKSHGSATQFTGLYWLTCSL